MIRPRLELDPRNLPQMEAVLAGLVEASRQQRVSREVGALSQYPRVRYAREKPRHEDWQTALQTMRLGRGDCEDLAIWLAADMQARGIPARVRIKPIHAGLSHAVVELPNGAIVDPSKARGMRGKG